MHEAPENSGGAKSGHAGHGWKALDAYSENPDADISEALFGGLDLAIQVPARPVQNLMGSRRTARTYHCQEPVQLLF